MPLADFSLSSLFRMHKTPSVLFPCKAMKYDIILGMIFKAFQAGNHALKVIWMMET